MSFVDTIINNSRINKLYTRAKAIDSLKEKIASFSDDELRAKTKEFQSMFNGKEDYATMNEILDSITNEAFAICREAAKRVLNQFPYNVQVMGALAMNNGDIAEMKTGEGKTLTATMAIYANALTGRGVHVVTVNEYLTKRDAAWMGKVFEFLGLSVGYNVNKMSKEDKKKAFACDITYTTNSEVGFDYLRDNMEISEENKVLSKGLNYCIIDECDSILLDDSRTPLIISGGNSEGRAYYENCQNFVNLIVENEDYENDIEKKAVYLTALGVKHAEHFFKVENLYAIENATLLHYINNALKANFTMKVDEDYIVKNNKVEIVDQNTGRVLEGRSFSDGIHQAIETKEHVKVTNENMVLATITYQNFFRLYNKIAGMTGTAFDDEKEFVDTYNMNVCQIPTNKEVIRVDDYDSIYATLKAKYKAVVEEVVKRHKTGQPVLVGTKSVAISQRIYDLILKEGLNAELLNAKDDAREAEIIAKAGEKGAITIATNMAGRGTDIKLGEGVKELGGLAVLGVDRHEARRIDNQLRGRSGRQGDVGYSKFYVSLEDDFIKRYSKKEYRYDKKDMNEIGSYTLQYDVNRLQRMIEGLYYDSRTQVLEFDNVLSMQREAIYKYRNNVLKEKDFREYENRYIRITAKKLINEQCVFNKNTIIDTKKLEMILKNNFNITLPDSFKTLSSFKDYEEGIIKLITERFEEVKKEAGEEIFNGLFKNYTLRIIDRYWSSHLSKMKSLKDGIFYRSYANQTPLTMYKIEGAQLYNEMLIDVASIIILNVYKTSLYLIEEAKKQKEAAMESGSVDE